MASPAPTSAYDAPAEDSASHGGSSAGVAAVTRVLSAGVMSKRASHVATRLSASLITATSRRARTKPLPDAGSATHVSSPGAQTTSPRELVTGRLSAPRAAALVHRLTRRGEAPGVLGRQRAQTQRAQTQQRLAHALPTPHRARRETPRRRRGPGGVLEGADFVFRHRRQT